MSKYLTAPRSSNKMPKGIPYIIGNELAERFSFYGMKTILIVFMTQYLMNSNGDLDEFAERRIREMGAVPSFKGYHGFPASICSSINNEVVHGIPSSKRVIKTGDLLKIDTGAYFEGYNGDSCITNCVGDVPKPGEKLSRVAQED